MQGRENDSSSLVDRAVLDLLYPTGGYSAETGGKLANLRPATGEPRFETKDLIFGLPQHAARGVEYYMCVDADSVRSGMTLGLQGIKDEVARNGTETDKECLQCTRI